MRVDPLLILSSAYTLYGIVLRYVHTYRHLIALSRQSCCVYISAIQSLERERENRGSDLFDLPFSLPSPFPLCALLLQHNMASFTPLESASSLSREALAGKRSQIPLGIVIDKSCRVYITQIPVERIERDGANALKAEFEAFGPVESYKMFTERSGRFIGSALCTYRNPADAALAVSNMNGLTIDDSTLSVSLSKDHGVVLLHRDSGGAGIGRGGGVAGGGRGGLGPREARGFLRPGDVDEEDREGGKWRHDKYEMLAEGKDMEEVLGLRRRPGRGRGGLRSHGDRVDAAFERYIAERDRLASQGIALPADEQATAQSLPPPPLPMESLQPTLEPPLTTSVAPPETTATSNDAAPVTETAVPTASPTISLVPIGEVNESCGGEVMSSADQPKEEGQPASEAVAAEETATTTASANAPF